MDDRKLHTCIVNTTIYMSGSAIQVGREIAQAHGWITKTLLVMLLSPGNATGQQYNLDSSWANQYGQAYNKVWTGVMAGSMDAYDVQVWIVNANIHLHGLPVQFALEVWPMIVRINWPFDNHTWISPMWDLTEHFLPKRVQAKIFCSVRGTCPRVEHRGYIRFCALLCVCIGTDFPG